MSCQIGSSCDLYITAVLTQFRLWSPSALASLNAQRWRMPFTTWIAPAKGRPRCHRPSPRPCLRHGSGPSPRPCLHSPPCTSASRKTVPRFSYRGSRPTCHSPLHIDDAKSRSGHGIPSVAAAAAASAEELTNLTLALRFKDFGIAPIHAATVPFGMTRTLRRLSSLPWERICRLVLQYADELW